MPKLDASATMMGSPRVSIVMPVYNGGHYFELALQSALAQTYDNFEIVIVNDGSRDGGATHEVCLRYLETYPELIQYHVQKNTGVGGALNHGIRKMKGDIFCWLSHDDIYLPEKTQVQVDFWRRLGRADAMLISDYYLIDHEGKEFANVRFDNNQFRSAPRMPLYQGAVNGCTVFIPAHLMRLREGPFNPALKYVQDFDYWKFLLREHEFFHLPQSLIRYRVHPAQDSQRPDATDESEALWRGMVDDLSNVQRAQLYGSSWRFFDQTHKILERSPNQGTAAYLLERRDSCIPETLVSVIIPFFNEVPLVRRALNSVLIQTHRKLEVILVDDGSTEPLDDLLAVIASEPRVRLLRQHNQGPGAARNFGLKQARGEYLAFLDADDVFLPVKVSKQLYAMAEAGAAAAHTSYLVASADRDELAVIESGAHQGDLYPRILGACPIATPTVMLHQRVLSEDFAFPPVHIAEDVAAWADLSARHAILGLTLPLTLVERNEGTASTDVQKGIRGLEFLKAHFEAHPVHARYPASLKELDYGLDFLQELRRRGDERHAGPTPSSLERRREYAVELMRLAVETARAGWRQAALDLLSTANRLGGAVSPSR